MAFITLLYQLCLCIQLSNIWLHLKVLRGGWGGGGNLNLSTTVSVDQEETKLGPSSGRTVGKSELSWTVAADIRRWRACVEEP